MRSLKDEIASQSVREPGHSRGHWGLTQSLGGDRGPLHEKDVDHVWSKLSRHTDVARLDRDLERHHARASGRSRVSPLDLVAADRLAFDLDVGRARALPARPRRRFLHAPLHPVLARFRPPERVLVRMRSPRVGTVQAQLAQGRDRRRCLSRNEYDWNDPALVQLEQASTTEGHLDEVPTRDLEAAGPKPVRRGRLRRDD